MTRHSQALILLLVGVVLAAVGAMWAYPPAGPIVLGLAFTAVALFAVDVEDSS